MNKDFPTIKQMTEAIRASVNSPEVTYNQETREFKVVEAVPYLTEDRCAVAFEMYEYTLTFFQAYNTWLDMQLVSDICYPVFVGNDGIEPIDLPF